VKATVPSNPGASDEVLTTSIVERVSAIPDVFAPWRAEIVPA